MFDVAKAFTKSLASEQHSQVILLLQPFTLLLSLLIYTLATLTYATKDQKAEHAEDVHKIIHPCGFTKSLASEQSRIT